MIAVGVDSPSRCLSKCVASNTTPSLSTTLQTFKIEMVDHSIEPRREARIGFGRREVLERGTKRSHQSKREVGRSHRVISPTRIKEIMAGRLHGRSEPENPQWANTARYSTLAIEQIFSKGSNRVLKLCTHNFKPVILWFQRQYRQGTGIVRKNRGELAGTEFWKNLAQVPAMAGNRALHRVQRKQARCVARTGSEPE